MGKEKREDHIPKPPLLLERNFTEFHPVSSSEKFFTQKKIIFIEMIDVTFQNKNS
jgi:hypothetical protein